MLSILLTCLWMTANKLKPTAPGTLICVTVSASIEGKEVSQSSWYMATESKVRKTPVCPTHPVQIHKDKATGKVTRWFDPTLAGVTIVVHYNGSLNPRQGIFTNTGEVVSDGRLMSWEEFSGD